MPFYSIGSIDARVVDADSGAPIEGANVIANWQLVTGSLDGERNKGQLEVKETVTDRDGRFHFDGFMHGNFPLYHLGNRDPQIVIFKPGYEYKRLVSDYGVSEPLVIGVRRRSQVNGAEVKLAKRRDNPPASGEELTQDLISILARSLAIANGERYQQPYWPWTKKRDESKMPASHCRICPRSTR